MKQNVKLRQLIAPLKKTLFHPQWFVFKHQEDGQKWIGHRAFGLVLDIGAGTQEIRRYLPADCCYVSLDYYETATGWYETRPHVFGNGQTLPVKSESVDTVLLLDVLEHLPNPDACIQEVHRILRPNGRFIIQVPFLYPLHDEPYDFQRWTIYGLRKLARRYDFQIEQEMSFGHPLESAALISNLALSKTVINWIRDRHPLLLFILLLPWIVFRMNFQAWIGAYFSKSDGFMPAGYRVAWVKQS